MCSMAEKLKAFVADLADAIADEDGEYVAAQLTCCGPSAARLCSERDQPPDLEWICSQTLEEPWPEVVLAYFRVGWALDESDFAAAYETHVKLAQSFYRFFQISARWVLPVGYLICSELRQLAVWADAQLEAAGEKTGKLEDAARVISKAFSICTTDRSPMPQSRKWGTYFFINLLFKIYFKVKRQNLCRNVLRSLKVTVLPELSEYPVTQQATLHYYQGVLFFLKEDYANAEFSLDAANRLCRDASPKNTRLIMEILVPTKLLRGVLPNLNYLRRHGPSIHETYAPFAEAIRTGNVKKFDDALVLQEKRLLEHGTYLIVEKTRALAVRRLFKKVYLLKDRSTRMKVCDFQQGLKCAGVYVDTDEVECMLANMIFRGHLKGYISHERSMVVLSANSPFPKVTSFVPIQ